MKNLVLPNDPETEVPVSAVAVVLGISRQRIAQLQRDGRIPATRNGQLHLGDAVRAYLADLQGNGRQTPAKLAAERLTEARLAEIEARTAKRASELVPLAEVVECVEWMISTAREECQKLPLIFESEPQKAKRLEECISDIFAHVAASKNAAVAELKGEM